MHSLGNPKAETQVAAGGELTEERYRNPRGDIELIEVMLAGTFPTTAA